MNRLTHEPAAKLTVFLLWCLMVPLLVAGVAGAGYALDEGWYRENGASFADSSLCAVRTQVYINTLSEHLLSNGTVDAAYDQPQGFSYRIADQSGNLLSDTTTENSHLIWESRTSVTRTLYVGTDEETDANVDTEESVLYHLSGYIDLPVTADSAYDTQLQLFNFLYNIRGWYPVLALVAGLLSLAGFVFLMAAAGWKQGSTVPRLTGLNRIPLDLFGVLCWLLASFFLNNVGFYRYVGVFSLIWAGLLLAVLSALGLSFCMTCAARFKVGRWWRNTLIFQFFRLIGMGIGSFFRTLPLTWKTVLSYLAFLVLNLVCLMRYWSWGGESLFLALLVDGAVLIVLICCSVQMHQLQAAGRALADGALDHRLDTGRLWLDFKKHGEDMNSVSQGIARAVEERMKSERFKTELITNVSHDLKTPLTAIVSYVDLLKKEPIDNPVAMEYIDILERQSAKLKKLTEDLVDASKATSGALTVSYENLNLGELLTQVSGEYEERLIASGLTPVLNLPEQEVWAKADGRLLWRVLDNLFQNICKYAASGTRVYGTVSQWGGQARLTLKNISSAPLNIPAQELLERFVRGDASRSSEGSGLGLSIARSLTELMQGTLELEIDGDLFKVGITLPLSTPLLPIDETQPQE